MTTFFDFDCPECGRALHPDQSCRWICRECATTYEACGCYLVELDRPDAQRLGPVLDLSDDPTPRRDPTAVA